MKKMLILILSVLAGLMPLQAAAPSIGVSQSNTKKTAVLAKDVKSDREVIFQDGFENYQNFATSFAPWVMVDGDNSTSSSINGIEYLNEGYVGSFICFDPAYTSPPITGSDWQPHAGNKYAACFGGLQATNDDWIISPPITLKSASQLKFWAKSVNDLAGLDQFRVGISLGSTNVADFTIVSGDSPIQTLTEWTEYTYNLAAYDGMSIRVGIHCVSELQFLLQLDDISVLGIPDSGTDVSAPVVASLAGNSALPGQPLNLTLNVADQSDVSATIEASYNISGSDVPFTMTKGEKSQYTYTGVIPAQSAEILGTVKFHLADLSPAANNVWTTNHTIQWHTPTILPVFVDGESFEGAFVPEGWQSLNIDGDSRSWRKSTGVSIEPGHTGARFALHYYDQTSVVQNGMLILPPCKVAESGDRNLKFWNRTKYDDSYIYHGIMISTTTPDPASFTELHEMGVGAAAPVWAEETFDLSAYAGKTIYIAFVYKGADADTWWIDDVKVTGILAADEDVLPPTNSAPTGTSAWANSNMTVSTIAYDRTGVASVVGHYKLTGQSTWTDFAMTANKTSNSYTGIIPAQSAPITGKIKFTTTDTSIPANTGITEGDGFDIAWLAKQSNNLWLGSINATATSSLGLNNHTPWKAGLALDLGTMTTSIKKISYMCDNGTAGPLNWSILKMSDSTTWGTDILASGMLTANPVLGLATWNDVDINDNTPLTGNIGLVVDLTGGGYLGRHAEGADGKSYLNYLNNNWIPLGTDVISAFPGDWTLKCFVATDSVGIEEETEIMPGKSDLSQNYPNPFNPTTAIRFYNNMTGHVKLTVMNSKGEQVATLVNSRITAGNHNIKFDGSCYNSGVYFYKLETPTATITKKMLLVK